MARYAEVDRGRIDEAVEEWKARCLLADRSLLLDDRDGIWTAENALEMHRRLNESPILGAATFLDKWAQQLENATEALRLFAAELLLVHFLFASSVTRVGKLHVINATLDGTDVELAPDSVCYRALDQSIGHPGIGFNTRRDLQVGYLIDFARRWKAEPEEKRHRLLERPWDLRDFADATDEPRREMRHILLHLLRPDDFERIASGTQKREIAAAFGGLLQGEDTSEDLDERLFAIRNRLEGFLPQGNANGMVDFYHPPLHGVWESTAAATVDATGDLEALLWKKQLVLYGPPGTSKTFRARELAETVIRRESLRRWGPPAFFQNQEAVERLAKDNVFWVQLHPGWGYEEFVRGLRLEGDRTRYRPGELFRVVRRVSDQQVPDGLETLPVVLVLDEINRTDLSGMLGEAFSLLERDKRDRPVELLGSEPGEEYPELTIPSDLFVIGTMNEIDQSVETLDFALRRRFLWSECPFERDTLLSIVAARWGEDVGSRFDHEDALPQLERLADRAARLNQEIEGSEELGRQYQVGHTYFADITFFLGSWLRGRAYRPPNGTYLWKVRGDPQQPVIDLWDRSLKPLLEQYLAGSDVRDDELRGLRKTFLHG